MKRPRLIAPDDLANKLVSQFKSGQRIKPLEVGQLLAVIKRSHEAFGERDDNGDLVDVKIPFALLDVIAAGMLERTNWQRAEARKRKGREVAIHHAAWRREYNKIKSRNPGLTDTAVAKIIARLNGGNFNTIRRVIGKHK